MVARNFFLPLRNWVTCTSKTESIHLSSPYSLSFLADASRVCVALSRAKWALFAVGNLSALAAKSAAVWARVRAALLEMGRVGPMLPLSCPRHSEVKGTG